MAYDAALAGRVRALLPPDALFEEKPMFGGLAFLLGGRMCAGVVGGRVVLWLGREKAAAAISEHPGVTPMDFTGRVMHNFVYVDAEAVADDSELGGWIADAVTAVTGRSG